MSGKTDTWMPLYIADYLADTQHLSTLEHGAYLLLLMAYWRKKGPLPDDDVKLARIAGLSLKQWKVIRSNVVELFRAGDGQLVSTRAEKEIEAARVKSEKARANALERYRTDDADAEPTQSERSAIEPADQLLTGACPPVSPSPSPDPTDHIKPSSKVKRAKKSVRYFDEDEPLDPDFYAVCAEYPSLNAHDEWEKFRDWHLTKREGTGSIKGSSRTWCKNAVAFAQRSNLRLVR